MKTSIIVEFKKLHDDAILPKYAHLGDAGMDCYTVTAPVINDTYVGYKLGFAVNIPDGYMGLLFPRSSNSKKDLLLSNSVGVIDSTFTGEVQARFRDVNFHNELTCDTVDDYVPSKLYQKGDAVCQLILLPYPTVEPQWVDNLPNTVRGDGGFGSTGN